MSEPWWSEATNVFRKHKRLAEVLENRKLKAGIVCRCGGRRPLHASLRSLSIILDNRQHDVKLVPHAKDSHQLLWRSK